MVDSRGGSGLEILRNRRFFILFDSSKNAGLNGFLKFEKFEEL